MADVSENKNAEPVKARQHRHHSRSRSNNPRNLRSAIMQHVCGFVLLAVYLLSVSVTSSTEQGTSSNSSVVFYLITCAIVYGLGYFLYNPIRKAWKDSGR